MKYIVILIITTLFISIRTFAQEKFPFEKEINAFKHQDSLQMPKLGGFLFIGSSSIRLWDDLEQCFAGKSIIKRGVGGSLLSQWVDYYTPYILFPYQPSKIFIYAGENDIAYGKSAQAVEGDLVTLWTMIREKLPQSQIYFMSIKESPSRAKHYNDVITANQLIKDFLKGKPNSYFIDVNTVLFSKKTAAPDSSLFKSDYLHLNSQGYDRWQKALKKYVDK